MQQDLKQTRNGPMSWKMAMAVVGIVVICTMAAVSSPFTQSSRNSAAADLRQLSLAYFRAWNARNEAGLMILFTDDDRAASHQIVSPVLRDWTLHAVGRAAILNATKSIWAQSPNIFIDVTALHASPDTSTVVAEILVFPQGKEHSQTLHVTDVVEFRGTKVLAVRAFLG